ncbi:hypothetical protein HX870_24540 [Pseudomonas gingeri]|uniref:hypothetical protein n=1 Tax=Pseudomonas gingeri TaxID=117681 RepID=UPI0015A2A9AE|nr:hypothetical protein [Pseudomonas gingeri]NWD70771.1 hypothetical protein [Pseudomonas gingeri]
MKFVYFNPGSVATILQAFAVYETPNDYGWIRRMIPFLKWRRMEGVRWWPTKDTDQKVPRLQGDEYESLYVKDFRVILVLVPGRFDRRRYLFEVFTNQGSISHETIIDSLGVHFSYSFTQRFRG